MPSTIKVSELQLGDVVRVSGVDDGYNDATVYQVDGENVRCRRVYVSAGDVEYSGHQIIALVGIEDFALMPHTTITLLRKGRPVR